jgi:imidazoleglycerol phosphate synthase glutamine amidotransferase subunit HisH
MRSIAVIDYGMGNLRSVVNALQVVTEGRDQVLLTSDPAQVLAADRLRLARGDRHGSPAAAVSRDLHGPAGVDRS